MKFFFADSQDMVDPSFNFEDETRAEWRIRQRHDLYPHEVFRKAPYDGILVSKAMVDGNGRQGGRYTLAQRQRFWRAGVRSFFRIAETNDGPGPLSPMNTLLTMGDCGAFSYVREEVPPLTTDDAVQFYERCGFDFGISVDHVILAYEPNFKDDVPVDLRRRQEITIEMANEFFKTCQGDRVAFAPIGVAQGWDPKSYAASVQQLQKIGYQRIALGGMVPLKSVSILECLQEIESVRWRKTSLHLLGVTRCEHVSEFQRYGVTSFDSTSPFLQAFRDGKDNYHTAERNYLAVRVPQVEGNRQLMSRIRSGELSQEAVRLLEGNCLEALAKYDRRLISLDDVLNHLLEYERVHNPKGDRTVAYGEILKDRPWDICACEVCNDVGIHVIIFRGTERNKRRGLHNLSVFFRRLQKELSGSNSIDESAASEV